MELSEQTRSFLEVAFSATLSNADRKKWIANFGIPDCDKICCQKLDPMLSTILLKDAIKVNGYPSCVQQFWLPSSSNPRGCQGKKVDTSARVLGGLGKKLQNNTNECEPRLKT